MEHKRFKGTYTLEEFTKEVLYLIREHSGYGIHALFDRDYFGSCPCAEGTLKIEGTEYHISTHCWRSGESPGDCCVLKVRARKNKNKDKVIALLLEALDETDWYGKYKLSKLNNK